MVSTETGVPPASRVMSGYGHPVRRGDDHLVAGFRVATKALKITGLPPGATWIWAGLYSRPFSRLNLAQMAAFSSGMPSGSVYFVLPALMASMAAFLILSGVSKSGSPADRAADHVTAGGFQRARLGADGDGGRRCDTPQGGGLERHLARLPWVAWSDNGTVFRIAGGLYRRRSPWCNAAWPSSTTFWRRFGVSFLRAAASQDTATICRIDPGKRGRSSGET